MKSKGNLDALTYIFFPGFEIAVTLPFTGFLYGELDFYAYMPLDAGIIILF